MHRRIDSEKNLGFGYGDHRCIAEGLAPAELEAVFGINHDQVKYSEPHRDVGIVELPVLWGGIYVISLCDGCRGVSLDEALKVDSNGWL